MADVMVELTQKWLNETYGTDSRYNVIPESGNTGWTTIYALRRALQIELGITATSNNFGPTTTAKFNERFPNGVLQQEDDATEESNVYAIIQGALWCKGYSTGASRITKHFYGGTGRAIKSLKQDAGVDNTTSNVTLNVMKALLSMDQFVLVSSGDSKIRTIQQRLNAKYEDYIGLAPCDGAYGREMNKAMIKALQKVEGYSVSAATGNFGSGTKANLPILPNTGSLSQQTEKDAAELVRFALYCNGYTFVNIDLEGWDIILSANIETFQHDMCLNVNGKCDTDTWMSLFLSCGNTDRDSIACDTRFEITTNVLRYLKNEGYQIVGRYLTGGDFKELRAGEPERIIEGGLKFFPIFQESSTDITYFTAERAKLDVAKAVKAARRHGIPGDLVIYFAVDLDPTDAQIKSYVLPYFEQVAKSMPKSYKVGIYGTRNACSQVMAKEYATTCFVSDMSYGYSGNMGFKMPEHWNLDQFAEISDIVISDTETIDLDKVAYSGRFPVVEHLYDSIFTYIYYLRQLESYYIDYKTSKSGSCTVREVILGVTNFLRSFKYGDDFWYVATLTAIDTDFIDYVKNRNIDLYNNLAKYADSDEVALTDAIGGYIDIGHLAATIEGYYDNQITPNFWFGWGGDLAKLMAQVDEKYNDAENENTHLELAKSLLGDRSEFNFPDVCSDADAIKIAQMLQSVVSNNPLTDVLTEYYSTSDVDMRISNYLLDLENVELDFSNLDECIADKMTGLFELAILLNVLGNSPSTGAFSACCTAFAEYINENYPTI